MPSVKSGTRRPGRCWQVRDWKTVRWAIRWSYSPRPRPVCVGVRVPPSGSWPPTRASPSRRLARSPRWATTGSPAPYTRFTRPWTAMLSSPRRRVGWRRRPTSSARGERGFSRRPSCAPSSPQKASQVCLLRVTSHARAVRVAFSPSRTRSAEVKPRPPACARLLRRAGFSSRSLRYFFVDLLPHLRRWSLDVQDGAPGHKDGRGLRGSSHLDPQRSVVLQKERSGYGFWLALDQLGGFILIEVGAGHVSDEDPVPQPLREYRRTRRRFPFLFHLLPPWRRDFRPKRRRSERLPDSYRISMSIPALVTAAAPSPAGGSATTTSVVTMRAPMEAAFWSAERVTIAGSMMPAWTRSSYSPVRALKPRESSRPLTFSATMEPSAPALAAIWRMGSSSARRTILAPVLSSPSRVSSKSPTGL